MKKGMKTNKNNKSEKTIIYHLWVYFYNSNCKINILLHEKKIFKFA